MDTAEIQKRGYVRFGVCGVGSIGSAHAAALYSGSIAGGRLAALCDISTQRREICKERYKDVPVFDSAEKMFESGEIDAVMIATPHYFHVPLALDAMRCKIHVLSEKPVAVRAADAQTAVAEAKRLDMLYGTMFNQRTAPLYVRAKEIIESGTLGELRRYVALATAWYRTQQYYNNGGWRATWSGEGGGVLLNQAPHDLDIWQWLFGMPQTVFAVCNRGAWHNIEVEDDATVLASYPDKRTAVFIASTGDMPGTGRVEITGSRGKMIIENGALTLTLASRDEREVRITEKTSFYRPQTEVTVYRPEEKPRDGHAVVLENFCGTLLGREKKLICPAEEALCELYISNAAYLSAEKGCAQPVPCNAEKFGKMLSRRCSASLIKGIDAADTEYHDRYADRWKP